MLYHGSHNQNLIAERSTEGVGTGTGCSGFFCCSRASRAREYGSYVYRIPRPDCFFDDADADADVLSELLAEYGIDYDQHRDLCWDAVVEETVGYNEDWIDLTASHREIADDDGSWFAQSLRIELARRQGFRAVYMNDECGSIVILREFANFEPVEICPECGEDRNGEDCDCSDE